MYYALQGIWRQQVHGRTGLQQNDAMQSPRTWRRRTWLAVIAGVLVFLTFDAYLVVCWRIGADVKRQAAAARTDYPGDSVEALMTLVADENRALSERNLAIWALGQLGDARALPLLRGLQTGGPCDHAQRVCERELAKAVKLAEGGLNATAWVWRRGTIVGGGGE